MPGPRRETGDAGTRLRRGGTRTGWARRGSRRWFSRLARRQAADSELRGEPRAAPLPLDGIFADMIEFNGGPMRCFA